MAFLYVQLNLARKEGRKLDTSRIVRRRSRAKEWLSHQDVRSISGRYEVYPVRRPPWAGPAAAISAQQRQTRPRREFTSIICIVQFGGNLMLHVGVSTARGNC